MTVQRLASSELAEVQSVLVRQKLCSDARDTEALRSCYTEDIELTTTFNQAAPKVTAGLDAVMAEIVAGWAQADRGERPDVVHFVGPAEITPMAGDRVRARSNCLYVNATSGQIVGWGLYTDELTYAAKTWKLAARNLVATFL